MVNQLLPVTLIVPTRNRPAYVRAAVASVLRGSCVPAQIVVADQSPSRVRVVEDLVLPVGCELTHQALRSRGVGSARNAGAAAARHDVLAFLDDDILVSEQWAERLVGSLLEQPERTVVTGRVVAGAAETAGAFAPSVIADDRLGPEDERIAIFAGRQPWDPLFSGSMAFRRRTLVDVGRFDERFGPGAFFPAAGDNDFGFRALEAGYRIALVKDAIAEHRAWRTSREKVGVSWRYGRGQGAFYAKHARAAESPMPGRLASDIGWHVARGARILPSQPLRTVADAAYLAGIVSGVGSWTLRYGLRG